MSAVRASVSEGGGGAGSGEDGGGVASALARVGLVTEHVDRVEVVERWRPACRAACGRGDRGWEVGEGRKGSLRNSWISRTMTHGTGWVSGTKPSYLSLS